MCCIAPSPSLWRHPALRNLLILLVVWEVVGQWKLVSGGALPPLSDSAIRFWQDRGDYPRHVAATVWSSTLGFLIGNLPVSYTHLDVYKRQDHARHHNPGDH